jgi:hypothetical protein
VQVPFQDEEATFSPEEVASMMIKTFRSYIESNFAANATEITKGCVVAVRSSLRHEQLNALAELALSHHRELTLWPE